MAQGEQDKSDDVATGSTAASRLAAKRAAKAAAKAAQRATTPVPNEVAQGVGYVQRWYEGNSRVLWLALGGVALAAAGWFAVSSYMRTQGHKASEGLLAGVNSTIAPIVAAGEEPPEDVTESYPTAQARAQKALEGFKKSADQFPDTPAGVWAMLGEGNTLQQLGKHAEAQKRYQLGLQHADKAPVIARMLLLQGLAFSLESEKKLDQASARFAELSALDDGAFKPIGEYHRARLLLASGKAQEAATALQALIKAERARPADKGVRFEGVLDDAQTLLDQLAVQLDQPKLRADVGATPGHGGPGGLTPDLLEQLRKQLGGGAEPVLNDEALKNLERQVDKSGAPASQGSQ